jgi:RNA polymerase sigma-70 factor (ECF subfamily)
VTVQARAERDRTGSEGPYRRTNAEWLKELRQPSEAKAALRDLGDYLRRTLARALASRANLDDSDLEDFAQDALIRILEGLDGFRGDSRFTTWAAAVAIRSAYTSLRRRRYNDRSLDDLELGIVRMAPNAMAPVHDPAHHIDRESLLDRLRQAIDDVLTERQRIAVLGELAGVPSDLLAARLGTNRNALYKLHHDARRKLKRALLVAGYSQEDVREHLLDASDRA